MKPVKIYSKGILFFVIDTVSLLVEGVIYFMSFLPMAFLLGHYAQSGFVAILVVAIIGWLVALIVFMLIIIVLKRMMAPKVLFGRFLLSSNKMQSWFICDRLRRMAHRSFFWVFINDITPFRYYFLRGMGAQIDSSLILGQHVYLLDPWSFSAGKNVLVGDGAMISGHMINHEVVTVGRVEVGNNVLIGAHSLVAPGVKIGNDVTIAAQSALPRGTVIPDGETWAGSPAHRVDMRDVGQRMQS